MAFSTKLTWTRDISRIIYKRCASCHREGGSSFAFTTYEQARPWAKAIKDEVLIAACLPGTQLKASAISTTTRASPRKRSPSYRVGEGGAEGEKVYEAAVPKFRTEWTPPTAPPISARVTERG